MTGRSLVAGMPGAIVHADAAGTIHAWNAAADGRLTGIAAIMRDVTTRFEELRAARKQLAEARADSRSRLA